MKEGRYQYQQCHVLRKNGCLPLALCVNLVLVLISGSLARVVLHIRAREVVDIKATLPIATTNMMITGVYPLL
jgi:hypothetical protein